MATYNENSTTSGNATSGRNLKRIELAYGDTSIKFAVNPEDYTQKEPNKASITQTKGGAWIDAWGAGIVEFTIKGITGVKGTGQNIDTGYQRWKELRGLFREVYDKVTDGEEVTDLIKLLNFTDNEYFYCYPTQSGIELYRSKSRPHVYQYTINLWGIRRIGEPEKSSGVIGNPLKSNSTASSTNVTSKNTSTTVAGGPEYHSKGISLLSEADHTTVTNTKTKTLLNIQEDCLTYLTLMEPLIGGKDGKISPVTGFGCTKNLTIQNSGSISNVNPFTGKDISSIKDILLSEVRYTNRVSVETYEMVTLIRQYSPEVLSPSYSLIVGDSPQQRVIQAVSRSTLYDSTIYEMIVAYQPKSIISKNEINHLKVILLESMMVYRELYSLYHQTDKLSTTLNLTNLGILINNIRAMIMYFTFMSTPSNQFQTQNIMIELRTLEKIITQVITDIVDYL